MLRDTALVVSPHLQAWFMPALITRAGLICDLVCACDSYQCSRHIRNLGIVDRVSALAVKALQFCQKYGPYDWVFVISDSLQGELVQRSLLDCQYCQLLPLTAEASTSHIHSKIGLSRLLSANEIPTPDWRVASDAESALRHSCDLTWPIVLKQDGSVGGKGIWKCENAAELVNAADAQAGRSFLLQRWESGVLHSVEALYRQGALCVYALSEVEAYMGNHGSSFQRRYGLSFDAVPDLEAILDRIGQSLGLHGFVNMSLIFGGDPQLPRIFECDVRTVAWLAIDHLLGGDFARALGSKQQPVPGRRLAYSSLTEQSISPFLPKASALEYSLLKWPFQPLEDEKAFLDIVLSSGILRRSEVGCLAN